MMTRILLILLLINSSVALSQVDTIHYLPPLFGRTNVDNHYISISTMSTIPVNVDIKRGDGTLIQSVVVTQAAPSLVQLGAGSPSQGIVNEAGLNTVNTVDGIIVTATEPVFVNVRHVQSLQGMCLTSKGNFALGKNFRSGHLLNNGNVWHAKASVISVMATEDNTTIDFTDISPNVIFRNTAVTGTTSNAINVTLDEGESYVIAAFLDEANATGNQNDVNGVHITSNKDIVVNSGSWLGGADGNGKDIGMDQIVPIEIAGTEYIVVEGDGSALNERPCVVAEFNNTQIFLNGSATPITTINAGDYYFVPNANYSANGNLYIQTSEPSYVYQSLAGTNYASNGLVFIPPIKCGGTREVLIPNVNLVGTASVSITARVGASVYVNGNPTPIGGATAVPGNPYWVTYDVIGGTGNFLVTSDSVIKVALLTLDGYRGSGGYFSGFSDLEDTFFADTIDFVVCQNSLSAYVVMNRNGPYSSINTTFFNPSLGGALVVDNVSFDTIFFTYSNSSLIAAIDSAIFEVCSIVNCSGPLVDTVCTLSTLIFNKIAPINTGVGDSVVICQDTSSIVLSDLIIGTPLPGVWVDEDQSGLLFNGVFQASLAPAGIYHFSYIVNGQTPCYDSTIVTINVLPFTNALCCPIAPIFTMSNINCNGGNNGFINIMDGYATQYSIDGGVTFQNNGIFSGLIANTYNVRLELGPDCTFDTTIVLSQPSLPLSVSYQEDSVSCPSLCDGSVSFTMAGGTLPYTYQFNGNSGVTTTAVNYSSLCESIYMLNVTDANNCTLAQNVVIESPAPLAINMDSIINETCSVTNGLISVTAIGGIPNYQYSIGSNPFQSNSIFTGLGAGSYLINVIDANSCTTDTILNITDAPNPIINIDAVGHVDCFGGNNGFVIASVISSIPNLLYSNGVQAFQTSNLLDSLYSANYTITVVDTNGCVDSVMVLITEPSPIVLNATVQNVSCIGDCDGEVYIEVSGGNSPYTSSAGGLVFSNNVFNQYDTIIGLCPNSNLDIVVKDSLNCLSNSIVIIDEPDTIQINAAIIPPSCFGICDGEVDIIATGGTGSIEYSLNNGLTFQNTSLFTNLCEGDYDILLRDGNLCLKPDSVSIIGPVDFDLNIQSVLNTLCGNASGEIVVNIGVPVNPNYTFTNLNTSVSITDPSTATFTALASGAYQIEAVDLNGCRDTIAVGVSDNALTVAFSPAPTHVTCFGECTGAFTVVTAGGTPPYQYSINTGLFVNSPTFTGLCAQNYVVVVQDAAGCIETVQLEITEPDDISFITSTIDAECHSQCSGEILFSNLTGGTPPYEFSIDGGINYFNNATFLNLCTGQYDLFVRDANNCISQAIATVQIDQATLITNNYTVNNLSCNNSLDGIISFATTGGAPPYLYSIDDGVTFASNVVYQSLIAGTYFVEIQDVLGCLAYDTVNVYEPLPLSINNVKTENICGAACDGEFSLVVTGGTSPYLFSIDNGVTFQTSNLFDNLCSTNYDINIVDYNNCQINELDSLVFIDTLFVIGTALNSNCSVPTGLIDLTGIGGTPGYLYSIDNINFSTNNIYNNLSAGTYSVYIQDVNSCVDSSQFIISNFPSPIIDSISSVMPCFGICSGIIEVFSSGGNGIYEYSLNGVNFQTSNLFANICPGVYQVTTRDSNGCEDVSTFTLVESDPILYSAVLSQILCFNDSTAIIEVISTGGNGMHDYSINGSVLSPVGLFTNLSGGNYLIDITDEIGCTIQIDTNIIEPPELQFIFNSTNPTCFGVCDGVVEIIASGGTSASGNYNYNWSLFNTNVSLQNNICAGTYSVILTDDNNCTADSINFTITEPEFATLDSVQVTGVDCFGSSIGSEIIVFAPNGNLLSFDNGSFGTNNQLINTNVGLHTVVVRDLNGCVGDTIEIVVPTPQPLVAFVSPDLNICPGDEITNSIIAVGGTTPYQYNWNNGTSSLEFFSEFVFSDTTYFAEVTDVNGCVFLSDTISVMTSMPPIIIMSNDLTVCLDEVVNLSVTTDGQSDYYFYNWNSSPNDTLNFIEPTIVSDTTFVVSVTDECNLTSTDSVAVNLFLDPILNFQIDSLIQCLPHTQFFETIIIQNGITGAIDWTSNLGTISSVTNTSVTIDYTEPGIDVILASYTSDNGCSFDVSMGAYIEMNTSPIANFSYLPLIPNNYNNTIDFINESIDYTASDWSIEYQTFNTTDVSFVIEELDDMFQPFEACLEVSNSDGCSDEVCQFIKVDIDQLIYVPNAFTPNEGYNSYFYAEGFNIDPSSFHMVILNRWGEVIFESYDINIGWDGSYNNHYVQQGVYIWKIDAALKSDPGEVTELIGHVTVLR